MWILFDDVALLRRILQAAKSGQTPAQADIDAAESLLLDMYKDAELCERMCERYNEVEDVPEDFAVNEDGR